MEQILRFITSPTQHDLFSLSHVDIYVLFSFICWFSIVGSVPIKNVEMDNMLNFGIFLTFLVWAGCLLCLYLPYELYQVDPPIERSTIYIGIFIATPAFKWIREKSTREQIAYLEAVERIEKRRGER